MATIATRDEFIQQLARGKGFYYPGRHGAPPSNGTAAAAASGYMSCHLMFNVQGTTYPSTLVGVPLPPTTSPLLVAQSGLRGAARVFHWAWIYRFGTLNLAATGNQFTHDHTFTELRRTRYGEASKAINLLPMVMITTATTVTAPVFRLRTVAAGAGYVDQAGNSVVGTKTMTMPAAATAVNSAYIFRLEDADTAVRNISNIEVTTAGSAGAASIWGVELLSSMSPITVGTLGAMDSLFGNFAPNDLQPAVVDTGTAVTAYLGLVRFSSSTTDLNVQASHIWGALNA